MSLQSPKCNFGNLSSRLSSACGFVCHTIVSIFALWQPQCIQQSALLKVKVMKVNILPLVPVRIGSSRMYGMRIYLSIYLSTYLPVSNHGRLSKTSTSIDQDTSLGHAARVPKVRQNEEIWQTQLLRIWGFLVQELWGCRQHIFRSFLGWRHSGLHK